MPSKHPKNKDTLDSHYTYNSQLLFQTENTQISRTIAFNSKLILRGL